LADVRAVTEELERLKNTPWRKISKRINPKEWSMSERRSVGAEGIPG